MMSTNKYTQPTIKEIAKRLKIAPSTVSRALHDHPSISWVTTMRVQKLAQELNYEPNLSAISFKQRKSFNIGVILPNLSEVFFSTALYGIEDMASTKKYNVLIGQSLDNPQREERILLSMKSSRVDGMIVSVGKNTINYDHFDLLQKYNIPIVFFDCIPERKDIHFTACNLQIGMLMAINKLVEKGITNIALVNGPKQLVASKQRQQIYFLGLKKNNLSYDEKLIEFTDLSKEGNQQAISKLLKLENRPTAIITFNDYLALDAIAIAKEQNLVINKDIFFISFANLPIWEYMDDRPMASIEQFPYKQGEQAAKILFSLIDSLQNDQPIMDYQQIIFESKLIATLQ
jgi:DNA-binding LacI/PurR family transcriptional regulator